LTPVNIVELIAGALGNVPPVIAGTWIVMILLLIFGFAARTALAAAPDALVPDEGISLRSIAEVLVEWLDGFVAQVSELHGARRYVPFFGSIFLFILTANFFGLIPGMEPPTADTDLTFALGAICFIYYLYQGFAHQGPRYLLTFFGPLWWLSWFMVVIEVADNLFRPFSLGVRLFANMFADHKVLSLFTSFWPHIIFPVAFYALGSIVCVVQALVFTILTMSYVRMAAVAHH
jgi:F-type H+-transporting ATPase subunit a